MERLTTGIAFSVALAALCAVTPARAQTMVKTDGMSADRREEITLSRAKPSGKHCAVQIALPRVDTLVDVSAVTPVVATLPPMPPEAFALFSVMIDTAGVVTGHILESKMPEAPAQIIANAIHKAVIVHPDTAIRSFRIRV